MTIYCISLLWCCLIALLNHNKALHYPIDFVFRVLIYRYTETCLNCIDSTFIKSNRYPLFFQCFCLYVHWCLSTLPTNFCFWLPFFLSFVISSCMFVFLRRTLSLVSSLVCELFVNFSLLSMFSPKCLASRFPW